MNIQEIISGIVVAGAAVYTLYKLVSLFIPLKQGETQTGCGSGCGHCRPDFGKHSKKTDSLLFIPPHFHRDQK